MPSNGLSPRDPVQVSVVIPTRDRTSLLRQALASVRALEGDDLELQIIVVDHSNKPEVAKVAAEFGCDYSVGVGNLGASVGRNAGLRQATGEFIAFLDDDDVWLPGHLRPHIELMRRRPEIDAVLGQVVNYDFELRNPSPPWPNPPPSGQNSFVRMLSYLPQIGATVVRSRVRETVGEFDDNLVGSEDWDWHLRLALLHQVEFVSVPCVGFRWWPSGTARRDDVLWDRVPCMHKVMLRNVRRAGSQRPPWTTVARHFIRYRGEFSHHFARSMVDHLNRGDRAQARLQLSRALRISPAHGLVACLRDPDIRRAAGLSLLP